MAWQVLKVERLPLGNRVLRPGCAGNDVIELQNMLARAGFYFGPVDGRYGVLTESAVMLAERMFGLRPDGIAGEQVIKMLRRLSKKMGRIVYTVKPHENLEQISQKFGVTSKAWDGIIGQGNPRKKIFPGMKLILNEKAVLTWDEKPIGEGMPVTGRLVTGGVVNRDGSLKVLKESDAGCFPVITADADVWEEVVASRLKRNRLLAELRTLHYRKIGLDFRTMKPELSGYLKSILKVAGSQKKSSRVLFVIAPVYLSSRDSWRSNDLLRWITSCEGIDWLMVEAQPLPSYADFEDNLRKFYKDLAELNRRSMQKIIPVVTAGAWHVTEEREVSYKEARIIRALNYRGARYIPEIKLTLVNYLKGGTEQRLYYRDYQGWSDVLIYIKKYHFAGLVISNQEMPDIALPDVIANAFTVLPERKFLEMV